MAFWQPYTLNCKHRARIAGVQVVTTEDTQRNKEQRVNELVEYAGL